MPCGPSLEARAGCENSRVPAGAHGVQAADTGLSVLSAFIGAEPMPMLKTLAARAGMPPAKIHRYLVSLCRRGFVEQDVETGRYRLGPASLRLAFAAMSAVDSLRVARPLMAQFSARLEQTVILAIWHSGKPTIAIRESPQRLLSISAAEGATLPILRSSIGNVFGAYLPRERTAAMIAAELLSPAPGSPACIGEVETLFAKVRQLGLARTTGQLSRGWNSFAAPVHDVTGELVAVLCALGPVGEFNVARRSPLAKALKTCAGDLSARLGHVA